MPTSISTYWSMARAPRYSLTFALPLLVAYEVLAISLSHAEVVGVRNGADVLLKSLFLALGGRNGLIVFGALLVGGGAWMVWQDYRRAGSLPAIGLWRLSRWPTRWRSAWLPAP